MMHKRTQPKPGDIDDLRRHAWGVLMIALEDVATADPDARRKAILTFWQGAGVYKGLVELADISARLDQLEEAMTRDTLSTSNGRQSARTHR